MNRKYENRKQNKTWKIYLARILIICLILPCIHIPVFAASNTINNGWYMIQSGNSSNMVLDVNNWNLRDGGNLEIYQKNGTTNQIFYLKYVKTAWNWRWLSYTKYYSIRCLHSGKFIHTYDGNLKNTNVHQWGGCNTDNALWGVKDAGNGHFYFMNKASGACLDNSGGKIKLGNNVITYDWNKSNAQKWALNFVSNSRPGFNAKVKDHKHPTGTYTNSQKADNSGNISANYPIIKVQISVSGKNNYKKELFPNYPSTSFSYSLNLSKLAVGQYRYKISLWNIWGDCISTKDFNFNIKEAQEPIPTNRPVTVYKQTDKSWRAYPYGYSSAENRKKGIHAYLGQDNSKGTGYGGGCGVLSIVNAVYYLKGTFIQPKWLADFSVRTGARYDGGTFGWLAERLCKEKGSDYGIKFVTDVANVNDAKTYLKRGNVAIVHVQGHFMALVNYDSKTDKYLVIDSCPSKNRGTSAGYRWLKESEFTGKMALSWTNESKGRIHIISRR